MKFGIVVALWGREYTECYADFVLRNHLSRGNIPSFGRDELEIHLFTTREDASLLAAKSAFKLLEERYEVFVHALEDFREENKYRLLSRCHQAGMRILAGKGRNVIFLTPDSLLSSGSLEFVKECAGRGYDSVLAVGLRADKEKALPLFEKECSAGDGTIPVDSATLLRVGIENLHGLCTTMVWGGEGITQYPSHLYFVKEDCGILARGFHLYPLYCSTRITGGAEIGNTIDGDLLESSGPAKENLYVVTDSKKLACLELSRKIDTRQVPVMNCTENNIAYWAKYNTDDYHRYFFTKEIILSYRDGCDWSDVRKEADSVAASVGRKMENRFLLRRGWLETRSRLSRLKSLVGRKGGASR
jgi:hypothetical protein